MSPDVLLAGRSWRILCGDSSKTLADLDSDSIDCGILDPPAGIAFMGKEWDEDKGGRAQWIAWIVPIFRELHRLLKPGGHAFVWALPRTSHWTATALEDAGFEIRDVIGHAFGSGFPKSLDLSKAIDAARGEGWAVMAAELRAAREARGLSPADVAKALGWPSAASVGDYENGGHVPPAKRQRQLAELLQSWRAAPDREVVRAGAKGTPDQAGAVYSDRLNVRFAARELTAPATDNAKRFAGWGTALKPAIEHWIMVRKPFKGSVAANALKHGTGGINIDAARVGTGSTLRPNGTIGYHSGANGAGTVGGSDAGRWPANLILSHASWIESACPACGVVAPFAAKFCAACGSPVECRRGGCVEHGARTIAGGSGWSTAPGAKSSGGLLNVTTERRAPKPDAFAAPDGTETVPAWSCLATCPDCARSILAPSGGDPPLCLCMKRMKWACPVAMIDAQSGDCPSGTGNKNAPGVATRNTYGYRERDGGPAIGGDAGGASRFFTTLSPEPLDPWEPLIYVPKPSTAEREAGCEKLPKKSAGELTDREEGSAGLTPRAGAGRSSSGRGNHHPTVKPRALLRHFYALGCPRNGVALDLFSGSGTTATIAAANESGEGWRCIAVDLSPEYVAIGEARCTWWEREGRGSLFAPKSTPTSATTPAPANGAAQLDMFGGSR